jgi:hypothetical protein
LESPTTGKRRSLERLGRRLTDEEWKSPGVGKVLLDLLDRADEECDELRPFRRLYYEAHEQAAVLEAKAKQATNTDIAYGVGVGVGSAILALAPSTWNQQPIGWICIAVGAVLIIGGIVIKVRA